MSSIGSQINYKQLLDRHGTIRVPMIQRDYAQGRPSETEVRDAFLDALERALQKPTGDPALPLNLDFVYGSVEGGDPAGLAREGRSASVHVSEPTIKKKCHQEKNFGE